LSSFVAYNGAVGVAGLLEGGSLNIASGQVVSRLLALNTNGSVEIHLNGQKLLIDPSAVNTTSNNAGNAPSADFDVKFIPDNVGGGNHEVVLSFPAGTIEAGDTITIKGISFA